MREQKPLQLSPAPRASRLLQPDEGSHRLIVARIEPVAPASSGEEPEPADDSVQSSPSPTVLAWTCEVTSLKQVAPNATELMDIAWKRRGSVAVGCPSGEVRMTSQGAVVVTLVGGTESDPAAVVGGRRAPRDRAAVVLAPHTTLLAELAGSDVLIAALPALPIADGTVAVFEASNGCHASVARFGDAAERFTLRPEATMLIASALRALGAQPVTIEASASGGRWLVRALLSGGQRTRFEVEAFDGGTEVVAGPRAVLGKVISTTNCDIEVVSAELAASK